MAAGGTSGQVLTKASGTDYDTTWTTLTGTLNYQGSWNASTNTPTLTSSVGTNGYYYVVTVAGTTNLNGITDWQIGDWAIFNGSVWQKIDQTNSVTSVNGYTGGVVLTYTDVGAANSGTNTNITSMTGVTGGIATPDYITFDTTPSTTPTTPGTLYWDSADGNQTLSLVMAGGTATQQIGEEQYYRIKASSAITNGQVVMFTGTVGASGALTGAPATGLTAATASYVMGVATQDIPYNGWGYITSFGLIRQINTSAFTAGDILYLDPSVPGGLTTTVPSAPNPKVQVCACIYSSASNGSLFVRPSFGGVLGQYEGDVNFTSLANGNLIIRDQTSGKWVNANLTAGTGVSVTNAAGSVTIANTGVTSVTGTAPVVSSGGATPAISMAAADTTTNGYLTSTDWNTFNNKQPAGTYVTSVTGSAGRVTSSGGTTPAIDLATTSVTAGTYTAASITVDAYGRITSASSGVGGATISNDTATTTDLYPAFANTTSGNVTTLYTSNAKLLYKPSTGELKAAEVVSTNGINVNADSVTSSYTIATGTNGFSVGPLTVASGVTLTVASGQRHIVI